MPIRARKSFKIAGGLRLNVSKTGVGLSAGAGPVRYTVHSSGRRTVSARSGIPGVSYQKSLSGGGGRSGGGLPLAPTKPGLFAPKGEKALFAAVQVADPVAMAAAGEANPDFRLPAYSLAGVMLVNDDADRARQLLSEAFVLGNAAEHGFTQKYLFEVLVRAQIADGITIEQYLGSDAVGYCLAELLQGNEEYQAAIDVLMQMYPSTTVKVSIVDILVECEQWDSVIEWTEGERNEDDLGALLCAFRGQALRNLGRHDAAHEALKEALRSRSRHAEIRHHALSERAQNYMAQGKKGMAIKDAERIYAENSAYPGLKEWLAEQASPSDASN